MSIRTLALTATLSLLAATPSPSPSPEAANEAANSLAATMQTTMMHQCDLLKSGNYDAYIATLSADFHRTGPFTQDDTRDKVLSGLQRGARMGMHLVDCAIRVDSAVPTPAGVYVRYYETDKQAFAKAELDIVTDAGADFVKGDDGTWIERDVHRAGFKFVLGGSVIHQEGVIDGVSVGPVPTPTPDESQALSQITITSCRFVQGKTTTSGGWTRTKYGPQYSSSSNYDPDGVVVDFINKSNVAAQKVTFAIRFRGVLDSTPNTTSSVNPGASSHWTFAVKAADKSGYVQLPVTCSVQDVVRSDGSEWPQGSPSPGPTSGTK